MRQWCVEYVDGKSVSTVMLLSGAYSVKAYAVQGFEGNNYINYEIMMNSGIFRGI